MATALIAREDTTSSTLSETAAELIAGALSQRIDRSFLFACWALAIYEYALVFDVEVEKIWKAKWSPVKCAYIIMRICNLTYLVANIHMDFSPTMTTFICRAWTVVSPTASFTSLSLTTWIIVLRLDACYNRRWHKQIYAILAISAALGVFMTVMFVRELLPGIVFAEGAGCILVTKVPIWNYFCNAPYILYELVAYCGMVYQYYATFGGEMKKVFKGRLLIAAIFQNATIHFLWLLAVTFGTYIYLNVGPIETRHDLPILSGTVATIAICRSVLDLRVAAELASPEYTDETELSSVTQQRASKPNLQRSISTSGDVPVFAATHSIATSKGALDSAHDRFSQSRGEV